VITPFCCLCGGLHPMELHHVIPKVHGGTDESNNIISICIPCHMRVHEFGIKRINMRTLSLEGIAKAKAAGVYDNRPKPALSQADRVMALRAEGRTNQAVADVCGIGVASVYRIMAAARSVKLPSGRPPAQKADEHVKTYQCHLIHQRHLTAHRVATPQINP
jgi:hypothetical protein